MAIELIRPEDRDVRPLAENADIAGAEGVSEDARRNVGRQLVRASDPHVHISQLPPGRKSPVHSHSQAEVMVVLEGAVAVNGVECAAGSIAYIPADEPYDIEAHEQYGVMFAIIRQEPGRYVEHDTTT